MDVMTLEDYFNNYAVYAGACKENQVLSAKRVHEGEQMMLNLLGIVGIYKVVIASSDGWLLDNQGICSFLAEESVDALFSAINNKHPHYHMNIHSTSEAGIERIDFPLDDNHVQARKFLVVHDTFKLNDDSAQYGFIPKDIVIVESKTDNGRDFDVLTKSEFEQKFKVTKLWSDTGFPRELPAKAACQKVHGL